VVDLTICPQRDPEVDNSMVVTVDRPGDFSTYTLCLVDLPEDAPFDPRYLCIPFTFKAGCPTELDCAPAPACPPEPRSEPEIGYLARDYASFRRLILDRLSVLVPGWSEHHVPDLGITLVELLAYTADYLSYHQDAVATEAYLDTARQRTSVRRHARLVDYPVHEGCNARAWVHVHTSADVAGAHAIAAADLSFLTRFERMPEADGRVLTWDDLGFLRDRTRLPILLKGILHPEDARMAVERGMDGVIVSNHGGRQVDGAVGALDALPGVVAAVGGRVPVLFDSGIRSGADIFKALALGAAAVCLGRPYAYGLAIAGEAGARETIRNVAADFDLTMGLAGCTSAAGIGRESLARDGELAGAG